MGKLNEPRTIPYDFRVIAWEGVAWLLDNSTRTYICSAEPMAYIEPLYWLDNECDEILPEETYIPIRDLPNDNDMPKVYGEWGAEVEEKEAWDEARESACANCVI